MKGGTRENSRVSFSPHRFRPAELAAVLAAERSGESFLLYSDGDGAHRVLTLAGDRLSVGRGEVSDLALSWDHEVSRLHALIERIGESWTLIDDQLSRNGTLVNGARVRGRRRLNDRDVIQFGSSQVLFRDPQQAGDMTPPAASPATVEAVTPGQRRVLVVLCHPLIEARAEDGAPPSNPDIAAELTVSVEAVRTHMKALFKLFGVPDLPQHRKRAELARRALATGIVTLRDISD